MPTKLAAFCFETFARTVSKFCFWKTEQQKSDKWRVSTSKWLQSGSNLTRIPSFPRWKILAVAVFSHIEFNLFIMRNTFHKLIYLKIQCKKNENSPSPSASAFGLQRASYRTLQCREKFSSVYIQWYEISVYFCKHFVPLFSEQNFKIENASTLWKRRRTRRKHITPSSETHRVVGSISKFWKCSVSFSFFQPNTRFLLKWSSQRTSFLNMYSKMLRQKPQHL